jgi:hypothetical protein
MFTNFEVERGLTGDTLAPMEPREFRPAPEPDDDDYLDRVPAGTLTRVRGHMDHEDNETEEDRAMDELNQMDSNGTA